MTVTEGDWIVITEKPVGPRKRLQTYYIGPFPSRDAAEEWAGANLMGWKTEALYSSAQVKPDPMVVITDSVNFCAKVEDASPEE